VYNTIAVPTLFYAVKLGDKTNKSNTYQRDRDENVEKNCKTQAV